MKLYFLPIIVFLFSVTNLNAQKILSGVVKDSTDAPLPFLNVVLKKDGKIISYTTTQEDGEFQLESDNHQNLELVIKGIGLKTYSRELDFENIKSAEVDLGTIILSQSPLSLDEVELNSNIPILVKKDTISFKVESFIDGSEEVAEEILAKLPGVEIAKDGTISVQGKNVEKVMVEGDDLFEKGYKLLTKNLDAGIIDKVEILENFSENILLKNIENSDRIALNLTLKEEKKNTLFGNISASYGTENFYEEKANIISFKKKAKYYFFGNLNNVGSDAIGDIYQIIYPDVFTSAYFIGDGLTRTNLINLFENTPNIAESRYNFNDAELASLNVVFNPNEKAKIKALIFYTSDERQYNFSNREEFLLPPLNFSNNEVYELRKNTYALSGKLDGLFSLNKNSQIEYAGRYSFGDFDENSTLLFNENPINENLDGKAEFTDHRITYTNRLNEFSALQITGRYLYDYKPQDYETNYFAFNEIFPDTDEISAAQQNSFNKLNFSGLEGSFIMNRGKSNISLKIGYTSEVNQLVSQILLLNEAGENIETEEGFRNNLTYSLGDLYLKTKYIHSINKISVRPSLDFHQLFVDVNNTVSPDPFFLIPGLAFSWDIDKKNKLFASYKYSSKNISINSVYDNFSLSGYRSLRRGTGDFQLLRGDFLLLSYVLGNWSDSFLVNTSIIYNRDKNYISNNSTIGSNFSQSTSIFLRNREFYSGNLTIDKFLNRLSSNAKLKLNFSRNSYQNIVNQSGLRDITTSTFTYGGEYRSVFSGPFNFHFGTSWIKTKVEILEQNDNLDNTSFFDFTFQATEKLLFSIKNENYYFGSLSDKKNFWFSDFKANYILKKNKYKFTLLVSNVFNTDSFSRFTINDTGSFRSDYRLLPRYFLLKFQFRF
ncbi:MAG: hypothetical protein CMH48_07930 [Muricauda sp.]|nr:TonB-dependent receptor [Allomuricauda sp.]MBC30762.1 hypothetical protein [Allomuricauda sp.]|tara:strand:- start:36792 stop:39446 length:2655 start_codon:yes stop_codon:yes gene_type:complete